MNILKSKFLQWNVKLNAHTHLIPTWKVVSGFISDSMTGEEENGWNCALQIIPSWYRNKLCKDAMDTPYNKYMV